MADTGQKFIRRNRMPRVHIAYDDPYDAQKKVEIPFVMGAMADLSGNDPGVEKEDVAENNDFGEAHSIYSSNNKVLLKQRSTT